MVEQYAFSLSFINTLLVRGKIKTYLRCERGEDIFSIMHTHQKHAHDSPHRARQRCKACSQVQKVKFLEFRPREIDIILLIIFATYGAK